MKKAIFLISLLIFITPGCVGIETNGINVSKDGLVALCLDKKGEYRLFTPEDSKLYITDINSSFIKQIHNEGDRTETQQIKEMPELQDFILMPTWSNTREGFLIPKSIILDDSWGENLFKQNTVCLLDNPFGNRIYVDGYPFWIGDNKIGYIEEIEINEKNKEYTIWIMDRNGDNKINLTEEIKKRF